MHAKQDWLEKEFPKLFKYWFRITNREAYIEACQYNENLKQK